MKKNLLVPVFLLMSLMIYSQDQIILKDGLKINCFVTSIDSAKVYYSVKKDGATIRESIDRSEIQEMNYGITQATAPVQTPAQQIMPQVKSSHKWFEGYIDYGFTFPTCAGDAAAMGDSLTLYMYYSTGVDFGFRNTLRLFPMNCGVGGGINFTSWLTLYAGVSYVPKGTRYHGKVKDYDGIDYKVDVMYKINYLEIPVALQLSTRSWRRPDATFFFIRGGIAPSYRVMAKYKYYIFATDGTNSDSDEDTQDFDWTYSRDFCKFVSLGIGGSGVPVFEIKYEQGTKNIMDPNYMGCLLYTRAVSFNLIMAF